MRSLEARIDRLEEQMGVKSNEPMLIIIRALVGCDPEKQGAGVHQSRELDFGSWSTRATS